MGWRAGATLVRRTGADPRRVRGPENRALTPHGLRRTRVCCGYLVLCGAVSLVFCGPLLARGPRARCDCCGCADGDGLRGEGRA